MSQKSNTNMSKQQIVAWLIWCHISHCMKTCTCTCVHITQWNWWHQVYMYNKFLQSVIANLIKSHNIKEIIISCFTYAYRTIIKNRCILKTKHMHNKWRQWSLQVHTCICSTLHRTAKLKTCAFSNCNLIKISQIYMKN